MQAFTDERDEIKLREITCRPIPARWRDLTAGPKLEWHRFPFEAAAANKVPKEPGFFCFLVGPPPAYLPQVGYPLYFGRSDRTLYRHFTAYLMEQDNPRNRPRARDFLSTFAGELTFVCSPFAGPIEQMAAASRDIRAALQPAFNDAELEAQLQTGKGAW